MTASEPPSPTPHILAVDDEVTSRIFLEHSLRLVGYEVTSCSSGEEALGMATEKPTDLILLDALMPGLDGFETCRRLKQSEGTREVPVVFLSELKDPTEKMRAFEAGAVDFLLKPVEPIELRARVKTHLMLGRKWRTLAFRARSEGILLQELIHAIDDALFIFQILRDDNGSVLDFEVAYANARACVALGENAEELTGQRREHLGMFGMTELHGDLCAAVQAMHVIEQEIALEDRSGVRYFRMSAIPLENDLLAVFFRDIGSYKRLQAERDANLQAALQAERMATLGTLAAGVGHEVNNPNNVLSLNLPILEKVWGQSVPILEEAHRQGCLPELAGLPTPEMLDETTRMIGAMNRASHHIKQIVRLLRDYVRGGSSSGVMQNLQINDVISSALELAGPRLHKATSHLRIELGKNLPLVRGHAGRLEQAVINLLNNAADALTGPEGGITVRTCVVPADRVVEFCVIDEGEGMPPEVMQRMRDPFFTTKHERGGTGLGVAIVQRIAEEHGGVLQYHSRVGEGTTASLRLPIAS